MLESADFISLVSSFDLYIMNLLNGIKRMAFIITMTRTNVMIWLKSLACSSLSSHVRDQFIALGGVVSAAAPVQLSHLPTFIYHFTDIQLFHTTALFTFAFFIPSSGRRRRCCSDF